MPTPVNLHWQFFTNYFKSPNDEYRAYLKLSEEERQKLNDRQRTGGRNVKRSAFDKLDEANSTFSEALPADYQQAAATLMIPDTTAFTLHTTYPGLLTGSGYRHETGSEHELKLGFFFDFTTGLPILPGSSVKGLLRSAFPGKPDTEKNPNPLHQRRVAYMRFLLGEVGLNDFSEENVRHLEHELFCGQAWNADKQIYVDIPMQQHDVFHDAIIGFTKDGVPHDGLLMGDDFITSHRNRKNPVMSPFTNPTPIQFLKVLPNVPVTFQFMLPDRPRQLLTPVQRRKLFNLIIQELGVGAKTRVGYGQLVSNEPNFLVVANIAEADKGKYQLIDDHYYYVGNLAPGVLVEAVASIGDRRNPKQKTFRLFIGGKGQELPVTLSYSNDTIVGKPCIVEIRQFDRRSRKVQTIEFKRLLT